MNHAFRPSAERLEAHVLLSSAATVTFSPSGSPIVETLTTNKTIYKVGQPIQITLTETNTTNAAVTSPTKEGVDSFAASQKFKDVWKSRGSKLAAPSYTLQPGQTHSITVTWNGHANVGSHSRSTPLTGTFEIDSTLANNSVFIAIDPRHGKNANAGIKNFEPNESLTLTS
jgi:hypothetical protein